MRDIRDRLLNAVRAPAREREAFLRIYHFYFLDKLGAVVLSRGVRGATDAAAIDQARALCATHAIEVREAERIVARLPRPGEGRARLRRAGAPLRRP